MFKKSIRPFIKRLLQENQEERIDDLEDYIEENVVGLRFINDENIEELSWSVYDHFTLKAGYKDIEIDCRNVKEKEEEIYFELKIKRPAREKIVKAQEVLDHVAAKLKVEAPSIIKQQQPRCGSSELDNYTKSTLSNIALGRQKKISKKNKKIKEQKEKIEKLNSKLENREGKNQVYEKILDDHQEINLNK